jgi:hypothetical protein
LVVVVVIGYDVIENLVFVSSVEGKSRSINQLARQS